MFPSPLDQAIPIRDPAPVLAGAGPTGAAHRRLRVAVCTALLAAAGLVGCGSGGATPDPAPGTGETTPATSSAASTPSPTAAPAGTQWAEAPGSGVRFAVPETWTVNDPAKVFAQGDQAAITKVAEALGIPADQFEAAAQSIDLFVVGPSTNGFSANINVTPNSMSAMPSAAAMASEMQSIGATTGTARTATTPIGDAIVLPYTLPLADYTVEGRAIVAETPDGFATITVSHTSAEEADALTEQVLDSLGSL